MKTGVSRSRAVAAPLTAVDRVVSASCYLHVQGSATLNASLRCTKKRVGLNDEQDVVESTRDTVHACPDCDERARTHVRCHAFTRTQFSVVVAVLPSNHCALNFPSPSSLFAPDTVVVVIVVVVVIHDIVIGDVFNVALIQQRGCITTRLLSPMTDA